MWNHLSVHRTACCHVPENHNLTATDGRTLNLRSCHWPRNSLHAYQHYVVKTGVGTDNVRLQPFKSPALPGDGYLQASALLHPSKEDSVSNVLVLQMFQRINVFKTVWKIILIIRKCGMMFSPM
jgi:hypothetical protein